MFDRPHHRRIASVLALTDAEVLKAHHCLFGGGTAISLAHGEYRESVDIDFICDSVDGYRAMRSLVNQQGLAWAFTAPVQWVREPRVDQYGVRTALLVENVPIKFEIVYEGRVNFEAPVDAERICGTWRLADADLVATKLMANADRWADAAIVSRDIIDLAMMAPLGKLSRLGVDKAERAYGTSIADAFKKAKAHLLDRPGRLKDCMKTLGMAMPEGRVRAAVDRLAFEKPAPASRLPAASRKGRSPG